MPSLGNDRFDSALEHLNRGLALKQTYPLINNYVRAVVATISGLTEPVPPAAYCQE